MIWPAEIINEDGLADVQLRFGDGKEPLEGSFLPALMQEQHDGIAHVIGLGERDWPDVIVFQRPLNRFLAEIIPHLQREGVAVVVEVDDDFKSLDPAHSIYKSVQPKWSPQRNWRHLQTACDAADLITVSTPQLARVYGRYGNVHVVPNYVPLWYLEQPTTDVMQDGVRFVWSGSLDAHPRDVNVTRGAVGRGLGPNASFEVIGPGHGVKEAMGLARQPIATGFIPLPQYPKVLSTYDVMLVPLDQTPFNNAKSYLKGLEAAACGLAVVATPTEQYQELEQMGLCVTVSKPRQWEGLVKHLSNMTMDVRQDVAKLQRGAIVKNGLTIEQRAHERVALWKQALDSRVKSHA